MKKYMVISNSYDSGIIYYLSKANPIVCVEISHIQDELPALFNENYKVYDDEFLFEYKEEYKENIDLLMNDIEEAFLLKEII